MKTLETMDRCKIVTRRTHVLLVAASALVLHFFHASGNSECSNNIRIPRSTQYNKSVGEPLDVECPVHFCSQQPPNMTWCKLSEEESCQPLARGPGISFKWEEHRKNNGVYFLKFVSVHENDTGFYKCSADSGAQQAVGHVLKINVLAAVVKRNTTMVTTNHTSASPDSDLKKLQWLLYFACSLLGLSIVILIISLLVYCFRKAKQRAISGPETPDEQVEISPKFSSNEHLQLETTTCGSLTNKIAMVPEDTNNDNKVIESTSDYTEELDSAEEQEESILYADLNHDVGRVANKWRVDDGQIEYATVCLNVASDNSY